MVRVWKYVLDYGVRCFNIWTYIFTHPNQTLTLTNDLILLCFINFFSPWIEISTCTNTQSLTAKDALHYLPHPHFEIRNGYWEPCLEC